MEMNEQLTDEFRFHKTERYTCLFDTQMQMKEIYLTSSGIEYCTPGKSFGPAKRPDYHLHAVISGKGYLRVGSQKEIELHGNQFFLVKADEVTYYRADTKDPWYYCWVSFSGSEAKRYMDAAGFTDGINVRECYVDMQKILECAQKLLDCFEYSPAFEVRRLGRCLEFISMVIESGSRTDESEQRHRYEYSPDVYVQHAMEYIQYNYSTIKVNDVAKYIGINRSYLTNIFKKKTGISPQKYLLQFRMNIACNLLLTTSLSIQEISLRIGYDNPLTFSKMFKSFYGISPRHYRNQGGNGGNESPFFLEEADEKETE